MSIFKYKKPKFIEMPFKVLGKKVRREKVTNETGNKSAKAKRVQTKDAGGGKKFKLTKDRSFKKDPWSKGVVTKTKWDRLPKDSVTIVENIDLKKGTVRKSKETKRSKA